MGFDVLSYAIGLQAGKGSGGSGGGSEEKSSYINSSFDVTAGQMTVEHGGSKIPDLIILTLNDVPGDGSLFYALAFSQRMIDKLGGGYINKIAAIDSSGMTMTMTSNVGSESEGASYYKKYGGIRSVNDSVFTVGNTGEPFGKLKAGESYSFSAYFDLA